MNLDDLVLVSVDDHVIEPSDIFDGRISKRFVDQAPKVVRLDSGRQVWVYEGKECPNFALNAVAGKPPEEYNNDPATYDDMRSGCYDVHERVVDMNRNGVFASMNFPSFPKFAGQTFLHGADKDLAAECVRAYNDWMIDDWCGAYPDRLIPLCITPMWDPRLAAVEIERIASKGAHAVTFPENPAPLGLPSWLDPHWDPFLAACEATGTVICLHIGSSSTNPMPSDDSPITTMLNLIPLNAMYAAAELLWSPVPRTFTNIKIALSEGGIGWVPYFLERADYVYEHHKVWTKQDFGDLLPSDVFRRNFWTCFIDDAHGLEHLDVMGRDHVMWEVDYPHSDSTWPQSPETFWKHADGMDADTVAKVTHRTALDLFQHRPSQLATVGELRASVS